MCRSLAEGPPRVHLCLTCPSLPRRSPQLRPSRDLKLVLLHEMIHACMMLQGAPVAAPAAALAAAALFGSPGSPPLWLLFFQVTLAHAIKLPWLVRFSTCRGLLVLLLQAFETTTPGATATCSKAS